MKTPQNTWKYTVGAMVFMLGLSVANAWHVSGRIVCDSNGNGRIDTTDGYVEGPVLLVESTVDTGVFVGAPQIQADGTFTLELPDRPHSYVIYVRLNPGNFPVLVPTSGFYSFTLTNEVQSFTGANFLLDCSGEIPPIPGEDCSPRTPGYWKNHPDAWPVATLTIGGVTYTKAEAIELMNQHGGDRSTTMVYHLVATMLNVACGAESSCITATITAANAWLAANPPGSDVRANSQEWKAGESLKDTLDSYNNGRLCAERDDD